MPARRGKGARDTRGCACGRDLNHLIHQFRKSSTPIGVDFRSLTTCFAYGERATHSIHPYPAKLLPQIPHLLLSNEQLCPAGALIADPFCGSGTVLLEASLAGHQAVGIDCNPLAQLVARVKTQPIDPARLLRAASSLAERVRRMPDCPPPKVVNLNYWYYPRIIRELSKIREAIQQSRASDIRDFLEVAFSVAVRKLSLADPRVPVPVRQNPARYRPEHWLREPAEYRLSRLRRIDVLDEYLAILRRNIDRMRSLWDTRDSLAPVAVRWLDVRQLTTERYLTLDKAHFDLILTSPPYGSAQKYVRSSSLSLGWLGLCEPSQLSELERSLIGREHYRKAELQELPRTGLPGAARVLSRSYRANRHRAVGIASYLIEMRKALKAMSRQLNPSGHVVLVLGDNELLGHRFPTAHYVRSITQEFGFTTKVIMRDTIRSRGLLTKRHRSAGLIAHEYILVMQRT